MTRIDSLGEDEEGELKGVHARAPAATGGTLAFSAVAGLELDLELWSRLAERGPEAR